MSTETRPRLKEFRREAQAYMETHKCRWSEACLAIKRRDEAARKAFGAPPKLR